MSEVDKRGLGQAHVRVSGAGFSQVGGGQAPRFHRGLPAADQGLEPSFLIAVADVFDQAEDLLIRKHRAYGPGNVAGAPGTSDIPGWTNGLMVRMHDKMARLKHLIYEDGVDVVGESVNDSVIDLLNYCVIFSLCASGSWPGVKATRDR